MRGRRRFQRWYCCDLWSLSWHWWGLPWERRGRLSGYGHGRSGEDTRDREGDLFVGKVNWLRGEQRATAMLWTWLLGAFVERNSSENGRVRMMELLMFVFGDLVVVVVVVIVFWGVRRCYCYCCRTVDRARGMVVEVRALVWVGFCICQWVHVPEEDAQIRRT